MSHSLTLKAQRWMRREEICKLLNVTPRTVQRRVDAGDINRQEHENGIPVYRVVNLEYLATRLATREDKGATGGDFTGDKTAFLLASTNAKLVDQLAEARAELDQWRTRAAEAEREAITWRARYHVARGRVEMEEE